MRRVAIISPRRFTCPQPPPWQTAPSAPAQVYTAPQATAPAYTPAPATTYALAPVETYAAPTQTYEAPVQSYAAPTVSSQTYTPDTSNYVNIGEYQGPVSTGITSSTTIDGTAPITVVPADTTTNFVTSQPTYTAPYQPQQAIPTTPLY